MQAVRQHRLFRAALLLVAAIPLAPAIAQVDESLPSVHFGDGRTPEGDSGLTTVQMTYQLAAAQPADITFKYETTEYPFGGPAKAGVDFVIKAPTLVVIPAGTVNGTFDVQVIGDLEVEGDHIFSVMVTELTGARTNGLETSAGLLVHIEDDDVPTPLALNTRDDPIAFGENSAPREIDPMSNDTFNWDAMKGGSFTLTSGPTHGTAEILPDTSPQQTPVNSRVRYTPNADFGGIDTIGYRLCDKDGNCDTATIVITIRPTWFDQSVSAGGRSGSEVLVLDSLRALTASSFHATPLVKPRLVTLELSADHTPHLPWDSEAGRTWELVELAPREDGQPIKRRLNVTLNGPYVDLYVGVDSNGDGLPSADEVVCSDGHRGNPHCDIEIEHAAAGGAYWVMLHNNREASTSGEFEIFDVPMVPTDGSLVVTGPGKAERLGRVEQFVSWNDDTLLPDDYRLAYVRVMADVDTEVGAYPLMVRASWFEEVPMQLRNGVPRTLVLQGDASHDKIFFDVPAGATRLSVTSASATDIDFVLVPGVAHPDPTFNIVPSAPTSGIAGTAAGPSGNETVELTGAAVKPGRWYVVPTNKSTDNAELTLTAEFDAVGPVIRSGSYFDAGRPGSGLFLYPAGDQWAGLWYTFFESGRPTWYYLQGVAPDANGVWNGSIYRVAWSGNAPVRTVIGQAVVTPTGDDRFIFSATLDGEVSTQPMTEFGRGCPALGGAPVDISSHWFDPAHDGTGYSVQMFADYEFYTTFVFDMQGLPMFLLAESSQFAGADATLDLERVTGSCPSCNFGPSTRAIVGTFFRRISGGTLQRIEVDAIYQQFDPYTPAQGTWSSEDVVQTLGGPGTTQGCAL